MKKKQSQAEIKITVRLPADVHAALVEAAQQHDRSLNSEIVHLAKISVSKEAREKKS